jgi:hypothetical protein
MEMAISNRPAGSVALRGESATYAYCRRVNVAIGSQEMNCPRSAPGADPQARSRSWRCRPGPAAVAARPVPGEGLGAGTDGLGHAQAVSIVAAGRRSVEGGEAVGLIVAESAGGAARHRLRGAVSLAVVAVCG